uniref:AAA+ ATPase domain-containing protein n=1 Tax=Leersia perrieri TaxID=77586 RepID=A0A0D9XZC2_9ORYZ
MEVTFSAARSAVGMALGPVTNELLEAWAASSKLGPKIHALRVELLGAQAMLDRAGDRDIRSSSLEQLLSELRDLAYDADDVLDELDYFRIQDELDGTHETIDDADEKSGFFCGVVFHAQHAVRSVARKLTLTTSASGSRANDPAVDAELADLSDSAAAPSVGKRLRSFFIPYVQCDHGAGVAPKLKFDRVGVYKRMTDIIDKLRPLCVTVRGILALEPLGQTRGTGMRSSAVDWREQLPLTCGPRRCAVHTDRWARGRWGPHVSGNCSLQSLQRISFRGTEFERRPITDPAIIEPELFGRQIQKRTLVDEIINGKYCASDITVLPVVGPGGIGKTTFAQHIYEEVKSHFQITVWLCVSQSFNTNNLAQEIVKQISSNYSSQMGHHNFLEQIKKIIQSKQFLLVLDDVWTYHEDEWKKLLAPFKKVGTRGNLVIVTTRIPNVAQMVKSSDLSIKLEGLEYEDSMRLFQACVLGDHKTWEDYPTDLQEMGVNIVKRLKGFPLAVKTVGRLLRNKLTLDQWKRIFESKEWEHQANDDDIMPALKLSYNYLPFHLQQCFSYCALFPEDYRFGRQELVNLWIGLGLLGTGQQNKTIEDIGHDYLDDLVDNGFFELDGKRHDSPYVVHDLLHALVTNVSSHQSIRINTSDVSLLHLRYLRIKEFVFSRATLPSNISRCYHLMVLDVQCSYHDGQFDFLSDMGNLLKLRHIVGMDGYIHSMISEVGKLKCLRELQEFMVKREMKGFELMQIGKLRELHGSLRITNLEKIEAVNEADDAKLAHLNHLDGLKLKWDRYQRNKNPILEREVLESLKPHRNLRELYIIGNGGDTSPKWLGIDNSITNLQTLHLEDVNWKMLPLPGKVCMTVDEDYQVRVVGQAFQNLRKLELIKIPALKKWSGNGSCDFLQHLQNLIVSGCPEIIELPFSDFTSSRSEQKIICFPKLKTLHISDCPKLLPLLPPIPWTSSLLSVNIHDVPSAFEQLDYREDEQSKSTLLTVIGKDTQDPAFWNVFNFNNLREVQKLDITGCPPISVVWLKMLTCLETLHIRNLRNVVFPVGGESNMQYELPVKDMYIAQCDASGKELTEVLSHFPKLSCLAIIGCQNVTGLGVMEQQTGIIQTLLPLASVNKAMGTPTSRQQKQTGVEEELAAAAQGDQGLLLLPAQIQELNISYCGELSFSSNSIDGSGTTLAGRGGIQGLLSLQQLVIRNCPKLFCLSLSSSSCSPFLTSLQKLSLWDLVGMDTLAPIPNLTELSIYACSGLRGGEVLWDLLAQGRLTKLSVTKTPNFFLVSEPSQVDGQVIRGSSRLQELETDDFAGFLAAPICRLLSSSLTMLGLCCYKEVECFTNEQEEGLHILNSLQGLRFQCCDKLRSLPAGLCRLPSLTTLWIRYCPEIRSLEGLPDSLKKLMVHSLPGITSLGILPDSLQELDIDDCRAIRFLDRLPSSLQELRIGNCGTINPLPKDGIPNTLRQIDVSCSGNEELKNQCEKLKGTIPIIMNID